MPDSTDDSIPDTPPDPTDALNDFMSAFLDAVAKKIVTEGKAYQRNRDFERRANEAGL